MSVKTEQQDRLVIGCYLPAHDRVRLECAVTICIQDKSATVWEHLEEIDLLECEGSMEQHVNMGCVNAVSAFRMYGGQLTRDSLIVIGIAVAEFVNAAGVPSTEWAVSEVLTGSLFESQHPVGKVRESLARMQARFDWSRLNNARTNQP